METNEPNVYPTILGGVSRGFWSPFKDLGSRSAFFWHLKTGTFDKNSIFFWPRLIHTVRLSHYPYANPLSNHGPRARAQSSKSSRLEGPSTRSQKSGTRGDASLKLSLCRRIPSNALLDIWIWLARIPIFFCKDMINTPQRWASWTLCPQCLTG